MLKPPSLPDEIQRLDALRSLGLLDTVSEERFDRVTRLACRLFGVPIALVSLVDKDRQWFKSAQGIDTRETTRDISFCGHAIGSSEPLVVENTQNDVRFADNPLVLSEPHIRFYAGVPVAAPDGSRIGTLCVISDAPRQFPERDVTALRALARMVEADLVAENTLTTDSLTGLSNRRGFITMGRYVMQHCCRLNLPLQMLCLQAILPTTLSRYTASVTLTELAQVLHRCFRGADFVGRIEECEFAVLISCPPESVGFATDRLNQAVQRFNSERPTDRHVTLKATHTSFDPDLHHSIDEFVTAAVG